jgi:carbonic anhydrase
MIHVLKYFVLVYLIVGSLAFGEDFEYVEGNEVWTGIWTTGKMQTPINIITKNVTTTSGKIVLSGFIDSTDVNMCLTNVTLQTNYTDTIMDMKEKFTWTKWRAVEFHFHSPSEHTIDGVGYVAELHMLFQGITFPDQLNSYAFLFEIDESAQGNEFIESLELENITPTLEGKWHTINVNIAKLYASLASHDKYNYQGSLSFPPCTENIEWFVFKNSIKVTSAELDIMMNYWKINTSTGVFEGNNRNVQALNGRKITLINCSFDHEIYSIDNNGN